VEVIGMEDANVTLILKEIGEIKKEIAYIKEHMIDRIMGSKEKIYRVRVGDYRILYEIYLDKKVIMIVNIDKRSRIYDR
jgi:mRNA-degrading endonuclease RelE of RelBE toxin-antitoxin system